jgi:hypothetical protein
MTVSPSRRLARSDVYVVSTNFAIGRGRLWTSHESIGDKAARIDITLPQQILRAVDAHSRRHGETRSDSLARAALDAMRKQG